MASATTTISNTGWTQNVFRIQRDGSTNDYGDLGTVLSADGSTELFLADLYLPLQSFTVTTITLRLASSQTDSNPDAIGPDFSDAMEASGTMTLTASNGDSVTIPFSGTDPVEPYSWEPTNLAEVNTFANTLAGLADRSLTVVFDDGLNGGGVDAGDVSWAFTAEVRLVLSDYDQSDKQFDLLALIEASNRNDVFQQSSLSAMGTLLDGEVGVGPNETILNRIRITPSATRIILREDDVNADGDTAVLDSRDYFLNGDGSDLTLGIMTASGSVDIPLVDNIDASSGTNATQLRVDIPAADRSLVNAIDEGDRFIIALWRAAVTDHAVNADASLRGDANWIFVVPEVSVDHNREHDISAGDVSWAFTTPQPAVTNTRVADDHAVNAGDTAWTFAVPAPTVTNTRVADDHTVNVGDAAWTFTLPEPAVTHTAGSTAHAVNAGDSSWAFAVPQPSITAAGSHNVSAGDASWTFATPQSAVTKTRVADDHTIDAVDASWSFAVPQPSVTSGNTKTASANAAAWTFAVPEPTVSETNAHRVDAGDAAWTFAVPQPSITTGGAVAVNAGDVTFAFVVPAPTVTKQRVADDHAVNAGDIAWSFSISQPSVSRAGFHSVDAGDSSWAFSVVEPTVRSGHAEDADDVSWTFIVSQPTVTNTRVADDHIVNADDVDWSFVLPEPTVTTARVADDHKVDASDISWAFLIPEAIVILGGTVIVDAGNVAHDWSTSEPLVTLDLAFFYNPLAAAVAILSADRHVARLTEGRIWAPELPEEENDPILRSNLVISDAGGIGRGPGARSRVPWTNTRIDVHCYGMSPYDTTTLFWAVYRVLMAVERQLIGATLVYDFVASAGPISSRDPDADWATSFGSFEMSAAYTL